MLSVLQARIRNWVPLENDVGRRVLRWVNRATDFGLVGGLIGSLVLIPMLYTLNMWVWSSTLSSCFIGYIFVGIPIATISGGIFSWKLEDVQKLSKTGMTLRILAAGLVPILTFTTLKAVLSLDLNAEFVERGQWHYSARIGVYFTVCTALTALTLRCIAIGKYEYIALIALGLIGWAFGSSYYSYHSMIM